MPIPRYADNTNLIGGQSYRMGDGTSFTSPTDPNSPSITQIGTAVDSQIGFLTNLYRSWQGLPPLPLNVVQPGVQFGVDTNTLLMIGGIVVVALLLTRKS